MLHTHVGLASGIVLAAVGLCFTTLIVGYTSTADPLSWSTFDNVLYFITTRQCFPLGLFMVFAVLLAGWLPALKTLLQHPYLRAIARLSYMIFLVHPILINIYL